MTEIEKTKLLLEFSDIDDDFLLLDSYTKTREKWIQRDSIVWPQFAEELQDIGCSIADLFEESKKLSKYEKQYIRSSKNGRNCYRAPQRSK